MHEVVNGANGSVTWCGDAVGLCPECERRRAETRYWMTYPTSATIVMPATKTFGTATGPLPVVWS